MANDLYDTLTRRLIQQRDSDANYKTVKAELWDLVANDKDRYLEMFFHNWFNNNWSKPIKEIKKSIKPYKPHKKLTPSELKEQRKKDANLRGVALMNIFLSDGETRLKNATGAQCRNEAGWFQLIAKWVKPNEIVGHKLTAEQLYNLKIQATPDDKAA